MIDDAFKVHREVRGVSRLVCQPIASAMSWCWPRLTTSRWRYDEQALISASFSCLIGKAVVPPLRRSGRNAVVSVPAAYAHLHLSDMWERADRD